MTASNLQKAVDEAWPAIEGALQTSFKATPAAKALIGLKDAFTQQVLPATATHLPPNGEWVPAEGEPGKRAYEVGAPAGLVELAVSVQIQTDFLKTVELKDATAARNQAQTAQTTPVAGTPGLAAPASPTLKGTAETQPVPETESPEDVLSPGTHRSAAEGILGLGEAALLQQIGYAMSILSDSVGDGPAAPLSDVVRAARVSFGEDPGDEGGGVSARRRPLTVFLHDDTFDDDLAKEERERVTSQLAGGTLQPVPWPPLRGCALIVERKPACVTWYTASNLQTGWDPLQTDLARITVASRLLLHTAGTLRRYRAPLVRVDPPTPPAEAVAAAPSGPKPAPRKAGRGAKKRA